MSGPLKPGVVSQPRGDEAVSAASVRFTLSELADEFAFFNHGILFQHAGFADPGNDPIGDWYAEHGEQCVILRQVFEAPVVVGLDVSAAEGSWATWSHILCGVPRHLWSSLRDFLATVAVVNFEQQELLLTCYAETKIPDPVLVDRHSILHVDIPQVPVTLFGLDGNQRRYVFHIDNTLRPRLVEEPPRTEAVQLWQQLQAGDIASLSESSDSEFMREYRRVLQQGPEIRK